ncbi:cory-CC-star protein [Actinotalea sp. K2]|uniref:cory-CC-star protein n=1 Tax=Actinotalea sp. K2 TaxID=2939438 RepID=UPI002017F9C4|nr:cory-CC-star protein [Actinotalea sp. K2]MCL3862453.1 DNA helicase [Actinotalea sp. K2]
MVDPTGLGAQLRRLAALRAEVGSGLREYYGGPYRRGVARARRDEEDLLTLLLLSESLGVPDPASYYTLELLPVLYEEVHDWHRRLGMDRSPLDHVACC